MKKLFDVFHLLFITSFLISCQTTEDFVLVTMVKDGYIFQSGEWFQKNFYIKEDKITFENDIPIKNTINANIFCLVVKEVQSN